MSILEAISQIKTNWKQILLKDNVILSKIELEHQSQKNMFEPHLHIFPPNDKIFSAFNYFSITETKVVILGQDPYINPNEAQGLAFSVPYGTKMPPSLRNIFKELQIEYGQLRTNTDLSDWAQQGVLLMNTALTVLQGKSNSNSLMWREYTDGIIKEISRRTENVVFILWGNNAIKKRDLVDETKHLVLTGVHPSPLSASRGFFGCNHFRTANDYLVEKDKLKIIWI